MSGGVKQEAFGPNRENFVSRLYQMLSTPQFAGIVAWNETDEGPSFVILDTAQFQEHVLVNEFNHANFSSFVRQLNKYDFHKVKFRDPHSRVWEFRHPNFRPENRDKPYLIKRKQQSSGRRIRRGDSVVREQTEVAVKAAEIAARDAEDLMKGQVTDLESRVDRLEKNNMQIVSALKMQQSLVEKLLNALNLPDSRDDDDSEDPQGTDRMVDTYDNIVPVYANQQNTRAQLTPRNASPLGNRSMAAPSPMGAISDNSPISPFEVNTNMEPQQDFRKPFGGEGVSTALVAVDDDRVREVLIKFLLNFGYQVDSVDNGVDVVRRVETNKYDFILIDCILKALDGVSAVELIRQTDAVTPILFLSNPTSADEHEMFIQRGASAVLYRPFSQAKLYSALQQFKHNDNL